MAISTRHIVGAINSSASGGEAASLAAGLSTFDALNNASINCVATINDLPDFAINRGRMYYVASVGGYRYSDGLGWKNDFVSTCTNVGNQLLSWGINCIGTLGTNTCTSQENTPTIEHTLALDWCCVNLAWFGTAFAIKTNGTLWSWGYNPYATSGNVCYGQQSSPIQESCSFTNWAHISGAVLAASGIRSDGTMYYWGTGSYGEGFAGCTYGFVTGPKQEVTSATDWCYINNGYNYTTAIKTNNTLWVSGRNHCGQLGVNDIICYSSPVQEVTSATNWCTVSAGFAHTVAIKTNGTLCSWGAGLEGRLGVNNIIDYSSPVQEVTSATDWCTVSAGDQHNLAIKTNGTLWGWGCGSNGQLATLYSIIHSSPVQELTSATNWCLVSAGWAHTVAIKTTGTLWAWGCGFNGQLGDGTVANRSSPVQEFTSSETWIEADTSRCNTIALKSYIRGFDEP